MGYSWTYGAAGTGLSFEVTYTNDGDVSLSMLEGSMDLNALWFSNGDDIADGDTSLKGKDNSLNMNGIPITWDSYAKISNTGLKDGGLIAAGETVDLADAFGDIDPTTLETLTLGIRATSVNGDDSVKLVSTASFFDDIPPELAGASFAYAENQAAGFVVGTVTATDADNSIASYQFTNETNTSDDGLFVINNLGEISFAAGTETSAANDFETLENAFTYEIQATDSEGNVSKAAEVSITVEDVNEQISKSARVDWTTTAASGQLTIGGLDNSGTPSNGQLIVTINGDFDLTDETSTLSIDDLQGDPTVLNPRINSFSDPIGAANVGLLTPGLTLTSSSATNETNSYTDLEATYTFDISDAALATILSDNTLMVEFENSSSVNSYLQTQPDFLNIEIEYTI